MNWTARAEELAEDAAEAGLALAALNAAAWSAGVDPGAVTGITGAALSLAAPVTALWVRSRQVRDDVALREAAADFEAACAQLHQQATDLQERVAADYARAAEVAGNRNATAAARAAARFRMGDCEAAAEILAEVAARAAYAEAALYRVPDDMAEVYETPYAHLARGGELPYDGDWLTGAPQLAVNG